MGHIRQAATAKPCGEAGLLRGLLLDSADPFLWPRGGRCNPRFDFDDAGNGLLHSWAEVQAAVGYSVARAEHDETILTVLEIDDPSAELVTDLDYPPVVQRHKQAVRLTP